MRQTEHKKPGTPSVDLVRMFLDFTFFRVGGNSQSRRHGPKTDCPAAQIKQILKSEEIHERLDHELEIKH